MSVDKIAAFPSDLLSSGSSIVDKTTHVNTLASTLQTATQRVSDSFSGMSILSSADVELEQLQKGVTTIMGCLSDSLITVGNGLQNASQAFEITDSNLANLFSSLDQSLQPFIGFEPPPVTTPAPLRQPAPQKHSSGKHWWQRGLDLVGGAGLVIAGAGAVVLGGGPEDPVGDAGDVAADEEAANLFEDAFSR